MRKRIRNTVVRAKKSVTAKKRKQVLVDKMERRLKHLEAEREIFKVFREQELGRLSALHRGEGFYGLDPDERVVKIFRTGYGKLQAGSAENIVKVERRIALLKARLA
ncbi:MAG: hypothetical protein JW772_01535, partial [Candidatus Diapherotrites archaeon]|nr:hypothetical protein [Candidatus Diapherotrites archaeon]